MRNGKSGFITAFGIFALSNGIPKEEVYSSMKALRRLNVEEVKIKIKEMKDLIAEGKKEEEDDPRLDGFVRHICGEGGDE